MMKKGFFFNEKVKELEERKEKFDRTIDYIIKSRFLLAIAIVLSFFFLYYSELFTQLVWGFLMILLISFFVAVSLHRKYKSKLSYILSEMDLWKKEIKRLKGDFSEIPDGSHYRDESHFYSSDLDVFGTCSLFQLINRSNTESGQRKLADWLKNPCINDAKKIVEKQDAVRELVGKNKWVKNFILSSTHNNVSENDLEGFMKWLMSANGNLTRYQNIYPFLSISLIITLLSLSLLNPAIYDWLYPALPVIFIGNWLYIHLLKPQKNQLILALRNNLPLLSSYSSMIALIDAEEFTSTYLKKFKKQINNTEAEKAMKKISQIGRIFELASLRGISYEPISRNIFFVGLNMIFLFDYFILKFAIQWKNQNRMRIPEWIESIAVFEVISSISFFSFANAYECYPKFDGSKYYFKAKNIGHPMIPGEDRVTNSFEIENNIVLITGSNMAGKSTFLRTVGVNILLANIGAPVIADCFILSRVVPFTYMRTKDSLQNRTSTFKAQLERLKLLIDFVRNDKNLFFLIDEPFSGTNTHDRHKGANQLLNFLLNKNVSGLFSTHDVEIASELNEKTGISNLHFASKLNNLSLVFDYKLKKGVCKDFNASFLLGQIWN